MTAKKRGYSYKFTPRSEDYGRYLLDRIPAALWRHARAKAKREGISMRQVLLENLQQWTQEEGAQS